MGTRYQDAKCNLCNHCKLSLRRWGIGPCYLPRFAFLSPGTLPLRTILLSNLVVHLPPAWSVSGSNACVGMSVRDWVLLPLIFSSIPSSLVICLLDLPTSFSVGVVHLSSPWSLCGFVQVCIGERVRLSVGIPPCLFLAWAWSWFASSKCCVALYRKSSVSGLFGGRVRLCARWFVEEALLPFVLDFSLTLSLFRNALLYWFFSIFC